MRFKAWVWRLPALAGGCVLACACYPHYDWREYRPDCARSWCGFAATFPGKVTNATRDIPVGAMRLPLTIHAVSIDGVSFAVASFDLLPGSDPAAARTVFETKLLDDVGATLARRGRIVLHGSERDEFVADTFDAEGENGGKRLQVTARFVERPHRLVEILVIGPREELSGKRGTQAVQTFLTSVRLE